MNNVLDFLEGHKTSDDIIILGQCPSTKKVPFKNGTFSRLKRWFTEVGVEDWDFHNVIPDKINSYDIKDVDEEKLRVCKKYSISNYKIDHPSPRNRNLNSKEYEQNMLDKLKCYLIMNKI